MYDWHYTLTDDRALPPLLLLHGWMGSCEDYTQIISRLRSQFYCVAIDLPGHGRTTVSGDDNGYDFIATATGIIRLLDELKIDRCAISGYSFGGRLALYLVLEFPDRFDRVMLESTAPGLANTSEREARIVSDDRIIDRLETTDFSTFVSDWYRQPLFVGIDAHPDFPKLLQRRLTNQPQNLARSLKYAGLGRQPYLGERLKNYARSILLLVGERDFKFITIAQTLDRECPGINVKVIPNCSHNIHFQQPRLWLDLFLNL
jgi:2-succinyl-6-hydroxy-2,4-cyclohexadiene-1-carboxylate synthase